MEKETLISIIVPVYNAETYLEACLDSVLSQTYPNIEVILVNDGSTDTSPEICRQYAARDSRIRLIHQDNAGVASARNRGLEVSTGTYVIFLDTDDLLMQEICSCVQMYMKQNDFLILESCATGTKIPAGKHSVLPAEIIPVDLSGYEPLTWLKALLGHSPALEKVNLSSVWAKVYRRSFLDQHNIRFCAGISMGEDILFNMMVCIYHPTAAMLPVVSYYYRYNANSAVHRYFPGFWENDRKFYKRVEEILHMEGIGENLRNEIEYQRVNGLILSFSNDVFHHNNPKPEVEKKADFQALICAEEYQVLISSQMRKFKWNKKIILFLGSRKQYYPLKALFFVRHLVLEMKYRIMDFRS